MLFNPFWALHAAEHFGLTGDFENWPEQYGWWLAKWGGALRANGESLDGLERFKEAASESGIDLSRRTKPLRRPSIQLPIWFMGERKMKKMRHH